MLSGQLANQRGHVWGRAVVAGPGRRGWCCGRRRGLLGRCSARRRWLCGGSRGRGRCRGLGRRRLRRGGGSLRAGLADDSQCGTDLDGLVLGNLDLQQHAGGGGGDLGVDLVGGDLQQGLVGLHGLPDLLQPPGDRALGHALTQLGQRHLLTGRATTGGGGGHRLGRLRLLGLGRLGLGGLGLGSLGRCGRSIRGPARGLARVADGGELGTHFDGLVLGNLDLQKHAGGGGGDLGVDLVGGHLQQRLVHLHRLAGLLQPSGDRSFGHALAELRESDGGCHTGGLSVVTVVEPVVVPRCRCAVAGVAAWWRG